MSDNPPPRRPSLAISLPFTRESVRQVLLWGANPDSASYPHVDIADWCQDFWAQFCDSDVPKELESVMPVLAAVECQFDMSLAAKNIRRDADGEDIRRFRVRTEWFEQWLAELEGRKNDALLIELQWRWQDYLGTKFPKGCAGEEIRGIDLVLLDSDIGGYLSSAVGSRGVLGDGARRGLAECVADLKDIYGELPPNCKAHFEGLKIMSGIVAKMNGICL